jgi:hypothetical protein
MKPTPRHRDRAFMHRTCDRCGLTELQEWSQSMFDESVICAACEADETHCPGYGKALQAEIAAVQAGNYRYGGRGLDETDTRYLAQQRAARQERL